MKQLLPLCIAAIINLTACNAGTSDARTNTTYTSPFPAPASTGVRDSVESVLNNNEVYKSNSQQSLPSTQQSSQAAATTVALNPEHGKPNHRCDIAVGAPLNSPPQQMPQTLPSVQTVPAAPLPSNNSKGTVKLNPAHGQPGHDCAVPVGQPLKS